jgi:hypothetical protein
LCCSEGEKHLLEGAANNVWSIQQDVGKGREMYTSFIESQGLNKVSEASGESEDYEGDHGEIHSQFECHVNYVVEKDREENELVLGCNT